MSFRSFSMVQRLLSLTFLAASVSLAQPQPSRPNADRPVATIDGKTFTIGDLRELLRNAPPSVLDRLKQDPKDLLVNVMLTRHLAADAKAAGFDQKFPYKQRLDWQVAGVLMNARIQNMVDSIDVPEADIEALYNKNIQQYKFVRATAIRVLYARNPGDKDATGAVMRTPEAARALAEDIVRQVRSGGNWVELGAKYSSEPDLAKPVNANTITPSFDLPAGARERLFATLPSQVTDPIQMNDSYVIFRVEQLAATPLPQVRPALRSELQQARGGDQVAKIQQGIQARVVLQQFFKAAAPDPNTGQSSTDTIDPAAVVAEINGRKITAKELSEALQGMQPSSRVAASQNPQRFLIETETVRLLAEEARKAGLDTKPPASDMIRWANEQVLMQAELDEITKSISSSLEEQQTFFKANADQYRIAKTKLIYVPFSAAPPPGSKVRNEEQSKARADEAAKRAAAGTDFVQLVYEYSEEQASKADAGNFMDIALTDARVPEDVRKALFAVKPGDLAGPVRQPNGFYLFKVIDNGVRPFDEVRNDIYIKLSDEKFKKWFDDYRAKIQVAITDAPAINAELAYQK